MQNSVVFLSGWRAKVWKFLLLGHTEAFVPWTRTLVTTETHVDKREQMHEFGIHGAQVDEMGANKFFFYGVIWLSIRYGSWANNPLEREAINNDTNPEYLSVRRPFAWKQYL